MAWLANENTAKYRQEEIYTDAHELSPKHCHTRTGCAIKEAPCN